MLIAETVDKKKKGQHSCLFTEFVLKLDDDFFVTACLCGRRILVETYAADRKSGRLKERRKMHERDYT